MTDNIQHLHRPELQDPDELFRLLIHREHCVLIQFHHCHLGAFNVVTAEREEDVSGRYPCETPTVESVTFDTAECTFCRTAKQPDGIV
jgi:hypothetical protein